MIQLIASVAFVTFFQMNNLHHSLSLNFKPFNCAPCLGFWTALALIWAPVELCEVIAITFGAGVTCAIIYRLLMKLS
jgi:hypothetical protein